MTKAHVSRRGLVAGVLSGSAVTVLASATPSFADETTERGRAKRIAREFYESYNDRDLDTTFDLYISPDVVSHTGYARDAWLAADKQLVDAFQDLGLTVFDQVAEDDRVATRWGLGGTFTGELWGMPPSGEYESFTAISIDRVQDGKIVEHWVELDATGFLQRLAD